MGASLLVICLFAGGLASATHSAPQVAPAVQSDDLQAVAEAVAQYFRTDPSGMDKLFAPEFLAQVPAVRLMTVTKQLYDQLGRCTGVKLEKLTSPTAGQFVFTFEKGYTASVTLQINGNAPHSITGFLIGSAQASGETLPSVIEKMKALPGQVSFLAQRLGASGPSVLSEIQPARSLAIGSAFKLYVLGALTEQIRTGRRHWQDVVLLKAHSLPSGILQSWPEGTPLTLQSLASLMISRSDNTAADELLKTVGREQVEHMLPVMGHSRPAANQPFLSTMEMFQLKWGIPADQQQQFLTGSISARRAILQSLKPPSSDAGLIAAINGATPKLIDQVEWFASAADLCHALAWYREDDRARNVARQVLAINPGIPLAAERWAYIGFKGGSEPGVISLNFLLRSQSGQWYVVGAIWNDPKAAVSETTWVGLVTRAIQLLP